jgi:SAM-dependent methyltransferase
MEQRETFEQVADLYADARPGYPTALYDDLERLAGLGSQARVMEVGCGAGQATGDLAARAGRVLALDPGERLVAEARARVAAANVDFVVARFEDLEAEPESFDLLASAQAWHWVDPALGFPKAAAALTPGGAFAIFGHVPDTPHEPHASALKRVFDRHLPGAWGTPPGSSWYRPEGPIARQIAASGLFGPVEHRVYAWTWRLTPELYGRYLRTDSSYHALPEAPRIALFDELVQAVADTPGPFETPWKTHLHVARKA